MFENNKNNEVRKEKINKLAAAIISTVYKESEMTKINNTKSITDTSPRKLKCLFFLCSGSAQTNCDPFHFKVTVKVKKKI